VNSVKVDNMFEIPAYQDIHSWTASLLANCLQYEHDAQASDFLHKLLTHSLAHRARIPSQSGAVQI